MSELNFTLKPDKLLHCRFLSKKLFRSSSYQNRNRGRVKDIKHWMSSEVSPPPLPFVK